MISFVWSSKYPFLAGSGGSETYTAGQMRALKRRGIDTRIITIGFGEEDGREGFPDLDFFSIDNKEQLSELDDTLIYITYPLSVRTKKPSYGILHCPPPDFAHGDPLYVRSAFRGVRLITASKFSAGIWRRHLKINFGRMPTVYPHADEAFSNVPRIVRKKGEPKRMLFAGRLHPDKGVYTLMAALHMETMQGVSFTLTTTTAGNNSIEGQIIHKLLKAHPLVNIVEACTTTEQMAQLMARHDMVVMPSTAIYWQEMFGMVSIEAQHAGCRVVASRSGGLPETNLGGLLLVKPDDPKALAAGIAHALELGPLTTKERRKACSGFNVDESVDSLLRAINYREPVSMNTGKKLHLPKPRRILRLDVATTSSGGWTKSRLQPEFAIRPTHSRGSKPPTLVK